MREALELFDAQWVVEETVGLADPDLFELGAAAGAPIRSTVEDVNDDGLDDLLLFFSMPELSEAEVPAFDWESVEAMLIGAMLDGTSITGSDSVRIVSPK